MSSGGGQNKNKTAMAASERDSPLCVIKWKFRPLPAPNRDADSQKHNTLALN